MKSTHGQITIVWLDVLNNINCLNTMQAAWIYVWVQVRSSIDFKTIASKGSVPMLSFAGAQRVCKTVNAQESEQKMKMSYHLANLFKCVKTFLIFSLHIGLETTMGMGPAEETLMCTCTGTHKQPQKLENFCGLCARPAIFFMWLGAIFETGSQILPVPNR